MNSNFKIIKKSTEAPLARVGIIQTPHGEILTPAFIPVATKATVKSLTPEQISEYISPEAILANTYHLYLEPNSEIVKTHGGFAKMMNYKKENKVGPTFTDSGGFQVFSLGQAMGHGISKIATSQEISESESENSQKEIIEKYANEIQNKNLFISIFKTIKKSILLMISNNQAENNLEFPKNKLAKIDNQGVTFKSYIDGSVHRFTPEFSVQIQHDLGADIFFAFDECTSPLSPYNYQIEAMNRTHDWAQRCLLEHNKLGKSNSTGEKQMLFAVIQGGAYEDLRRESARVLAGMGFDGFGIGGSFTKNDIGTAVKWVTEELNQNLAEEKPRHLLGLGEPIDIFLGIENGIDTFDCVAPTRIARNGRIYSPDGPINILNAKYKNDFSPICEDKNCYAHNYSKSYLAHLFRSKEMLAATIASIHNLHFLVSLTKNIRQSILDNKFLEYKKEFLGKYYGNNIL